MSYKSKHTGAVIDQQIGRVVDGSVVTDNTLHEVTSDDTKPVTGAAVEKGIMAMTDSEVKRGSRNPVSGEAVVKELEDVARLVDGKLPIDNLHAPMLIFEVMWDMGNNDVPLKYSTSRAADVAREMYNMQTSARRSIETTVMLVMSSPDIDIVYRVPLSYANGSWRGVVNDRLRTYESAWLDGEENTQYIGLHCVEITLSVDTSGVVAMASKVRQIQVTSEAYRDEMQGPVYVKREQSFTEDEKAQARQNIGAADENKSLSLTVLDNGNIRLSNPAGESRDFMPATPSGDPMHYAYVAAGAVWNASTGYWVLNGLTDITTEQMSDIFVQTAWMRTKGVSGGDMAYASCVTNIRPDSPYINGGVRSRSLNNFGRNSKIRVLYLNNDDSDLRIGSESMMAFMYASVDLERVIGIIDLGSITAAHLQWYVFGKCLKLEQVQLYGVKFDLDLSSSLLLSAESATYMLENADSTAQFTITFHADRQEIYEANVDFVAARDVKPNITILYQ